MKKRTLLVLTTVILILAVMIPGISEVQPLNVTISLDKETVAVGETVKATIKISGGTKPYRFGGLDYWVTQSAGSSILSKATLIQEDGETFISTFMPDKGESLTLQVGVYDADNRYKSIESSSIPITGGAVVQPLEVEISQDKETVAVGETIKATIRISGGTKPYRFGGLEYWVTQSAGSSILSKATLIQEDDETFISTFMPDKGESLTLQVGVYDADNRYKTAESESVPIVKPIIRGDANDDKNVDFKDLFELIEYLAGGPECASMENANANSDPEGVVDVLDAVWLIDYLVGD